MANTQSNDTPKKIGTLTVLGHSYIGGSNQNDSGTPNVYRNSMLSKLCGMLGIHQENVINLAQSGSYLTRRFSGLLNSSWGGYAGSNAFIYPVNSAAMNSSTDVVKSDKTIPGTGSAIIVHGVNDIVFGHDNSLLGVVDWSRDVLIQRAVKNSIRSILSRLKSGVVFCSQTINGAITWTGAQIFGGTLANGFGDTSFSAAWSDVAIASQTYATIQHPFSSGSAYRSSTTNGSSFTLTLPRNFTGGTIAVQMFGSPNGATYLAAQIVAGTATSVGATTLTDTTASWTPGALVGTTITCGGRTLVVTSNTATVATGSAGWVGGTPAAGAYETTTILVNGSTDFVTSGTLVILVESEEMLVTSGLGTTAWVVTRGVNGTTKTNHYIEGIVAARVTVSPTSSYVDWTGTSSAGAATATISNGSPAVITEPAHGLKPGDCVVFSTTGSLPSGLTAGRPYYVSSSGLTANTFSVSASSFSNLQSSVSATGTNTTAITSLGVNTNTIAVGQPVTGTNVPVGAYVAAIVSSNAFTLSVPTTGALSTITFGAYFGPGPLVATTTAGSGTHTVTRRTLLSGQGAYKEPIPVVQRFTFTNADAGKTLIGTCNKNTSDTSFAFMFDSWWIEAEASTPTVMTNLIDYRSNQFIKISPSRINDFNKSVYVDVAAEFDNFVQVADIYTPWYNKNGYSCAAVFGTGTTAVYTTNALSDSSAGWAINNDCVGSTITAGGKTLTVTGNWLGLSGTANAAVTTTNTSLTDTRISLAANQGVGSVITCNGKTMTVTSTTGGNTFVGAGWSGGGNPGNGFSWTNTSTIYGSGGWSGGGTPTAFSAYETTSITFTANSSTFTPTVGQTMTWGGSNTSEIVTVTSVSGTSPNLTIGIARAQLNSSKTNNAGNAFFPRIWFGSFDWMHTDMIHPNEKGHAICAEQMYRAFQTMPIPTDYQLADVAGNWQQLSQDPAMGIVDNYYYYPDATVAAASSVATIGKQFAIPIRIPKRCMITEIGCWMGATAMAANGVIRFGIFFPDYTHARPGNLIQDFGTRAATTANAQVTLTGIQQVLDPGIYWLSAVQQVAATGGSWDVVSGLNYPYIATVSPLGAQGQDPVGYSRTGITTNTAFAAAWIPINPGYSVELPNPSSVPRIYVRLRAPNYA